MTIIKYVGLTAEASALIEGRRRRPDQTESEIIVEALKPIAASSSRAAFDLGQGVRLQAGDRLFLFLSEKSKSAEKPDGTAEVGAAADGIYVESRKVEHSRGSPLAAAMLIFQQRAVKDGRAEKVVSLNAWLKWHVLRDDRFVPLYELKDPALARRRGPPVDVDKLFAELDAL
jgi:hypothetical protein